jgi:hypothetical protein
LKSDREIELESALLEILKKNTRLNRCDVEDLRFVPTDALVDAAMLFTGDELLMSGVNNDIMALLGKRDARKIIDSE